MASVASRSWARDVRSVFASYERKARDSAAILAAGLGLHGYAVIDGLHENDLSATGYLPPEEFEDTVNAFFAQPESSIRGWETAARAQARIVGAVQKAI
jgi:broad specificity phosphatase PhoE